MTATLTREKIVAMEPVELGPAVAEHIFKAKVIGKENFPELRLLIGWFGKEAWKPMKGNWRNAEWRNSDERAWLDCPQFGEDIGAAWKIIECLKDKMDISVYTDGNGKYASECGKWTVDDCETAPEAICKAALLAVLNL